MYIYITTIRQSPQRY